MWHLFLAQKGYIVASLDNRGTPAPRGREWRKSVYRQIGILASADQAAGVEAMLERFPFIDRDRVGVWGWSGGGSMTLNLLFRYPDIYSMGIAVAPSPTRSSTTPSIRNAIWASGGQRRRLARRLTDHPRRRPRG